MPAATAAPCVAPCWPCAKWAGTATTAPVTACPRLPSASCLRCCSTIVDSSSGLSLSSMAGLHAAQEQSGAWLQSSQAPLQARQQSLIVPLWILHGSFRGWADAAGQLPAPVHSQLPAVALPHAVCQASGILRGLLRAADRGNNNDAQY